MANNLKTLRLRAGLSKKELAEKVGTTQLQVQRIESNKYPARLELATALSAALEKPLDAVFPGASRVLAALNAKPAGEKISLTDRCAMLRDVGIEGDVRQHVLKVLLRGHREAMFFPILANEVDRIFSAVQDEAEGNTESSFIVFNTNALRVAINLKALIFCHFLWDADFGTPPFDTETDESDESAGQSVQVFFAEDETPTVISSDGDADTSVENQNNYLNIIFYQLDTGGVAPHERLHIVDEDGESAFLRVGDIALLTAPLWVVDPDERVDEDEGG